MTQKELFLELARPNKEGISRWVETIEFTKKYSKLELLNGLSWGRKSSSLAKKYIVETDKNRTNGNKIDRIRLNGFNKTNAKNLSQIIRNDIKKEILKKRCVVLGTNTSCDHPTEPDHKDGRKNDPRIMNTKTQEVSDFQPLSKPANDAKRQFCKECKATGNRYDAKKLGYTVSFIQGSIKYDEKLKCIGCFWYDPLVFRAELKIKKIIL
ncbi:ulcer-associated gene restriction endonuclease (iceA) [uncultured Gammaproteobacteria bacterium]|jgi:hypothetical protein|nr:ulcer-associated gene restriction endonuclease (iceA) [uncultured Gammaproteobacteria bacterium]CAC9962361.1 ulcer-associated gene restriction endonuclease (iceA) [uncultured Gammaproteobacteria bacterium]CAC9963768.1 ulcer-associated gene restriction endonuclease (iceA) [uncultured Gammaproteobacteria bacterium]CAC9964134.1 ulcer-associated gene restriction endonuclease (iceA) [uncultured Gammaproteobacteria bacterium]